MTKCGFCCIFAIEKQIINKSGAFYTYKTTKIGQGRENAKQYLKDNNKVLEALKSELTVTEIKPKEAKKEAKI